MIALVIIIVLLILIFYIGSGKAEEKGHGWLAVPVVLIFFIICAIGSIKSCADSNPYPRYDYYEHHVPR